MNSDFVAEILRATGSLRSGDPAGAAAVIQSALVAAGLSGSAANPSVKPNVGIDLARTLAEGGLHLPPRTDRLRKPLSEVVRTLAAGRDRLGGMLPGLRLPAAAPELAMPEGAQFLERHYSCAAGARRYRLYVPACPGEDLQGLIVMLHGCTQNPEDFAVGTGMNPLAEERRLLIAYPAQTGGDNPMSCWNWFRPSDQMRDVGEPAIIAGLTESLRAEYGIASDRVFIAGLSAGGAMAAVMGETYPELYGAVGVHSGLAYGSANDVMSAFTAMRGQAEIGQRQLRPLAGSEATPRMIVFHGTADTTVHPSNAERIVASQGLGLGTRSDPSTDAPARPAHLPARSPSATMARTRSSAGWSRARSMPGRADTPAAPIPIRADRTLPRRWWASFSMEPPILYFSALFTLVPARGGCEQGTSARQLRPGWGWLITFRIRTRGRVPPLPERLRFFRSGAGRGRGAGVAAGQRRRGDRPRPGCSRTEARLAGAATARLAGAPARRAKLRPAAQP